jgi:hypothetical protein
MKGSKSRGRVSLGERSRDAALCNLAVVKKIVAQQPDEKVKEFDS